MNAGSHDGGASPAVPADDLPEAVLVADATGSVVVFNAEARRMTGITAHDAVGRHFRDVLPLRDGDGRDWWKLTDPYGGLRIRRAQPERLLQLPGGRECLVAARYVRQPARYGAVVRLVVTLRDASSRARQERGRADLVSTVAHELRSPLTSVKGFTKTLLGKWDRFTDDQKRVMLETVNADADRVTRLITELLDVSRIEAGRLETHRQ
ncbi:MAG: histidine kinase dimerization/phospho-acceptor domain-containing protein, partial [Nocardioidaceae bacterium]